MAEVRIEVHADGGTYVEVAERCDLRTMEEQPEAEDGDGGRPS